MIDQHTSHNHTSHSKLLVHKRINETRLMRTKQCWSCKRGGKVN